MHKIGFIGSGNMGGALIIAAARSISPKDIIITNRTLQKAQTLADQTGCDLAESNEEIIRSAHYVVLAVKPNMIRDVVTSLAPVIREQVENGQSLVLVTIAAGVAMNAIKECLNVKVPVIRIMPNTPAMVGKGMSLLTADELVTKEMLQEFQEILAASGSFEYLPESAFDYTTSISSCAPAYAFMFIDALADGAVQVGVPRAQALQLAAQTVLGSAAMVLETGLHPDQLKDNVCSPGGSTIVGVNALEQHGFRYAVAESIIQSTKKNLELGK